MQHLFCPYQESKILKEQLGFIEPCLALFDETNQNDVRFEIISSELVKSNYNTPKYFYKPENYPVVLTPTWSQTFEWFREKHKLYSYIEPVVVEGAISPIKFDYVILEPNISEEIIFDTLPFHTNEEAQLACLIKLIEIVKTK